jgi:predicted aldo/keto reductase-like oxidoreductase
MFERIKKLGRREFLKTACRGGIAAALSPLVPPSYAAGRSEQKVPLRAFGKTGKNVSILSLGGMFDIPSSQLLLKQAIRWGVTYWDTANSYGGGRSEKGIGKYFAKYPEDRKKIFLVTKSGAWTRQGMTRDLNQSLERMQTDYIDLFFVHGISGIREMDEDVRAWGEAAKSQGKIRLFGFSTHSNMEACLLDAARLGWIDGIMMTYNYRLMHTDRMKRAVDACAEAGIGLTAMKTQGGGQMRTGTETELMLGGRFLKKGFTDGQARLKAIWDNPRIASICSQMPSMNLLMTNTAAAMNRTRLSKNDLKLLEQYARETASDYCTGCSRICESAVGFAVPIGDIMRYLMYSRSYDDKERAVALFRGLSYHERRQLAALDFSPAEHRCPRNLPITRLMREAEEELT